MTDLTNNIFLDAAAEFVRLQNEQDLQAILQLMHKESFAYKPAQQMFLKLFSTFELRITLLDRRCIAIEGEFAYVRMKVTTEKLAGPDFRNNTTELLLVFRLIGTEWKIWCQTPLTFQLL